MESGDQEITLNDVAAILFDEFDQATTMSPKAFYKITYFIDKQLSEQGYTTDIDYFWYKYGTMTATANSSVAVEPSGERSEVLCSITTDELSIDPKLKEVVRSVTRDVLLDYEQLNTEGLTDLMYEDAPYDFQRKYRQLDTTIQTELRSCDEGSTEFNRDLIRKHVHEFINTFPEKEFPEHLNNLYLWYDILSTALDDETATLDQIEEIAEVFWTIVMLELAIDPETGIDPEAFADELNIDDPDGLQGYLTYRLQQLEKAHHQVRNVSEHTAEAADAVMMSQLDFAEI